MYKAIKEIGGDEIGDEGPTEKAEHWLKGFKYPHVEKVETEQVEDFSEIKVPDFEKELAKINGIGAKTAWDITKVFSTREDLENAISHGDELPFRDDIEIKLISKYGK